MEMRASSRGRSGWRVGLLVVLLAGTGGIRARGSEIDLAPPDPADTPAAGAVSAPRPSWGKRILWYVPNRVLDLMDIFRLRLRLGPGLAAGFRITDYGAFYYGKYNTVYAGLPGPRYPRSLRPLAGKESLSGIVLAGVDATDNTRHGPEYKATEIDLGAQLLLVGADAGFDIVEIGDFLAGFLFFDPVDDDFPQSKKTIPEWSSGIVVGPGRGAFEVDPKPESFACHTARLDYLHTNVQRRVSEPLRATDAYFAVDPNAPIDPPETQFRLRLYATLKQGNTFDLRLSPDLEMDIQLPNIENRLRIFVETGQADELPQTSAADTEDSGFNVGMRKYLKDTNISIDVGVGAKWPPVAFARISWTPVWEVAQWGIRPEQRFFYQTDDGLGTLTSLYLTRWLGASKRFALVPDGSFKAATKIDGVKWASSLKAARVVTMLDEKQRGHSLVWEDTARGQGIQFAVFGTDDVVDKYRASFGFRGPLYKRWIYWELDPGLEWAEEEDYDTAFFLQIGLDVLFWGQVYE